MTISYVLAAEPIWYIVGTDGLAAGGAQLFTYDSLTRMPRDTYQDPGGAEANTNPIIFDLNGTFQPPIYWQIDPADPNGYYIEVFDSAGNLLWQVDNFPSGTGGGSNVTTLIPVQNFITNNQFINHIGTTASPIGSTNLVIAPSNHKGFTPAQTNPLVGTFGVLGPDIRFIKDNINSTDQITFNEFNLNDASLNATGDMTPATYIQYQCTMAATEAYKNFQFPITQKVKNLSAQPMTFTLWARDPTYAGTLNIFSRQYYGSGTSATPEALNVTYNLIGNCVLSSSWTKFVIKFVMPSVSGNSLGIPGKQTNDDAIYIEIGMPLGALCNVQFTKPCLFLGSLNPTIEFESYDQIDSIDSTARCGDVKTSMLTNAPLGWLPMNDSTIGNTGSGATFAGEYTFQLYATIYTSVINTWAPVSTGRTGSGNTTANAITDFLAGKTLALPLSLGRALANAGSGSGLSARVIGQNTGSETISISAMPSHNHPGSTVPIIISGAGMAGGAGNLVIGSGITALNIAAQGSGAADGNMSPTSFMNVFIKL